MKVSHIIHWLANKINYWKMKGNDTHVTVTHLGVYLLYVVLHTAVLNVTD